METGEKNRVSCHSAMFLFCEESLGKIDAQDVELFRTFLRLLWLESVDYFGTSEYFSENFDGDAITKISLYTNEPCDEHAAYFRR